MKWNKLTNINQIEELNNKSFQVPQVIFKHSTRCFISKSVLQNFESDYEDLNNIPKADFYFLDLIAFRNISNHIAEHYNVTHESPQLLMINKGKCTYNDSHSSINLDKLLQLL